MLPRLEIKVRSRFGQSGTRQSGDHQGARGPRIGARQAQPNIEGSLALDATLRAAAKFQVQRRGTMWERDGRPGTGRLVIRPHDLRLKVRRTPTQRLYILVVDSSGSMAAYQRMAQVKGMLLGLLREVYRQRDGVAVIAFRGAQSELLLSPTRSPEAAQAFIEALPTGGRTPLAHALWRVEALLTQERRRRSPWTPVLVLVTDGRPNRSLTTADPLHESLAICQRLADSGLQSVVIDTEAGAIRLGLAAQFATALSAPCVHLETVLREDRL
jgi:magnesium chelatase subunit D